MTAMAAPALRGTASTTAWRIASGAILVGAADFLFYGQSVGGMSGVFAMLLLGLAALNMPAAITRPYGWALFALCFGLCLALVESVNWLAALLFGLFFAALFTDMRPSQEPTLWLRKLLRLALHIAGGAANKDMAAAIRRRSGKWGPRPASAGGLESLARIIRGWLLPILVFAVFLALFAWANPVMEGWLLAIDRALTALENWLLSFRLESVSNVLTPGRLVFWLVLSVIYWGALRADTIRVAERPVQPSMANAPAPADDPGLAAFLFSRAAVARTLALSNLLFLAQNLAYAAFIWQGMALPDRTAHAEYAHRSAYPLVAAALLAAAFVLIAMRETGGLKQDRLIRRLIYLWLLQNLILVFFAIWRTELYVTDYSLTYLRLSALLWMGLVLLGLMLIVIKIVLDKSNNWLIGVNLAAALSLLTVSCAIDMGRIIADYNVAHSREMGGGQYALDFDYLVEIGPSALPALQRLRDHLAATQHPFSRFLADLVESQEKQLAYEVADWRRWTFRGYRLARELRIGKSS